MSLLSTKVFITTVLYSLSVHLLYCLCYKKTYLYLTIGIQGIPTTVVLRDHSFSHCKFALRSCLFLALA